MPRLRVAGLRNALVGPVSLELAQGGCVAIAGASGAGKSVLLRLIADLVPGEGEVWLDGRPRSGIAAPDWRRQVVYNAAESSWWEERVGAHFATPPVQAARALGLPDGIFARAVALCSTGERQRLALLRALALDPPVLLLDEPTGALDPDSVRRVEALLIERCKRGGAVLLVTHDAEQAARLGAARFLLREGALHPV